MIRKPRQQWTRDNSERRRVLARFVQPLTDILARINAGWMPNPRQLPPNEHWEGDVLKWRGIQSRGRST